MNDASWLDRLLERPAARAIYEDDPLLRSVVDLIRVRDMGSTEAFHYLFLAAGELNKNTKDHVIDLLENRPIRIEVDRFRSVVTVPAAEVNTTGEPGSLVTWKDGKS